MFVSFDDAPHNQHYTYMSVASTSYQHTTQDAINSPMRFVAVSATLPNIDEIAAFLHASEACKCEKRNL